MPRPIQPARARRRPPFSRLRIGLMLFALVAVIGLTVDLVQLRLRAERAWKRDGLSSLVSEALIDVTTSTQRWMEVRGRFSVKQPPGWSALVDDQGTYDVTLRGPYKLELSVAVRPADAGGWEALHAKLAQIEESLHLTTSLEAVTFQGRPAWRRTMPLQKSTVEALDFLAGDQAVHVLMAGSRETFADFRPVLAELRESLQVQTGQPELMGENP